MSDPVERAAVIDALGWGNEWDVMGFTVIDKDDAIRQIKSLPSAQAMLYGYPVEHLVLIATVLRKENLPPERIAELLMDIGRIVAMVRDEFEDTLRKTVDK